MRDRNIKIPKWNSIVSFVPLTQSSYQKQNSWGVISRHYCFALHRPTYRLVIKVCVTMDDPVNSDESIKIHLFLRFRLRWNIQTVVEMSFIVQVNLSWWFKTALKNVQLLLCRFSSYNYLSRCTLLVEMHRCSVEILQIDMQSTYYRQLQGRN